MLLEFICVFCNIAGLYKGEFLGFFLVVYVVNLVKVKYILF